MAKCFDVVGYIEPCNAVRQKYTGRALLITGLDTAGYLADIEFSDNGLEVISISGEQDYSSIITNKKDGDVILPVTINAENPFGVTVQGNTDSGRVMDTKTIPVSIPATRGGKAEEFIMGLIKGLVYPSVIILENTESEKNFGSSPTKCRNDIFGAYSSVRLDPASVTRSEYENGGAWTFNLICDEPVPNVICSMAGLSKALDTLNV